LASAAQEGRTNPAPPNHKNMKLAFIGAVSVPSTSNKHIILSLPDMILARL
jgi:hypothetical protein